MSDDDDDVCVCRCSLAVVLLIFFDLNNGRPIFVLWVVGGAYRR